MKVSESKIKQIIREELANEAIFGFGKSKSDKPKMTASDHFYKARELQQKLFSGHWSKVQNNGDVAFKMPGDISTAVYAKIIKKKLDKSGVPGEVFVQDGVVTARFDELQEESVTSKTSLSEIRQVIREELERVLSKSEAK